MQMNTAVLCFCPTDLQEFLNAVNKAGKSSGMEMNIIETKTMVISKYHPQYPKSTLHFKENLYNKQTK